MSPPPRSGSRLRRISGWTAILCALVVGTYLLRRPLFERRIATGIEDALAASLGGTWRVDSVEGGWITDASVVGVRALTPPDAGPMRDLSIDRAEVTCSAFGLLSGLSSIRSLRVTGLVADVDLTRAPRTSSASSNVESDVLANLPREIPDVSIDGAITLRTSEGDVRCDALKVRGGSDAFTIEATGIASRRPGEGRTWTDGVPGWSARFTRPSATHLSLVGADPVRGVEFSRIEIELAGPAGAQIEGEARVAGGVVVGSVARDSTHVAATGIDLARLPSWVAAVAGTTLPRSGRCDATYDASPGKAAAIHVKGSDWSLLDLPPATFEATVAIDDGVRVVSLDGVSGGVHVVARDVAIDMTDPWRAHSAGDVRVSTDDLEAALRAFGVNVEEPSPFVGEGPIAVAATISRAGGGPVEVRELVATTADARIEATGSVTLPARPEDLRDARIAVRANVTADLTDATSERRFGAQAAGHLTAVVAIDGPVTAPGIEFTADVAALQVEGRTLRDVRARGTFRDGTLELADIAATDAAGAIHASGAFVPATGAVRGAKIDGDLTRVAALFDTGEAGADAPTIDGTVHVSVRLDRAPSADRPSGAEAWLHGVTGSIAVTSDDIAVAGVHARPLAAHVRLAGAVAAVETFTATMAGAALDVHATVDLVTGRVRGLDVVAPVKDLAAWMAAMVSDTTEAPAVAGSGMVTLNVPDFLISDMSTTRRAPNGARLDAAFDELVFDGTALGGFKLSATARDGEFDFATSLRGGRLDADVHGTVASGGDDGVVVTVADAVAQTRALRGQLAGPSVVSIAGGRVAVAETVVNLARATTRAPGERTKTGDAPIDGRFAAAGRITVRGSIGDAIDLQVEGDDIDAGLLSDDVTGTGKIRVVARGAAARPDAEIEADFPSLRCLGVAGAVHVSATQDADGLHVTRLEASAVADAALAVGAVAPGDGVPRDESIAVRPVPRRRAARNVTPLSPFRLEASGDLPWRLGSGGLESLPDRSPSVTARFRCDDAGPWIARAGVEGFVVPRAEINVAWTDGVGTAEATATGVRWTPGGLSQYAVDGGVTLRARLDGASASVEVAGTSTTGSTLRGSVRCAAGLDWNDPASSARRMLDAPVEGDAAIDVPDVSARRALMPDLAEIEGRATGRVTIAGTVSNPTFVGRLDASDVAFRAEGSGQGFDRGNVRLAFAGREIRVEAIDGRLGYGPVAVTGTIGFPSGADAVADLRIHGENVLVVQSDVVRLRADVDLTVKGPIAAALVSGDVRVLDALVALELDSAGAGGPAASGVRLFSLPDGPLGDARLDLRVTADKTVRIVADRVRGAASVDLRIRGTGALPEPEGRIEFPGLRVMLPFSLFTVETGILEFPPSAPFAPRVRATARFRSRDYDVTARASGDVTALEIGVTTVPSLSRDDALLLVVTGASPQEFQARGFDSVALSRAQSLVSAELLAQVVRPTDPMERSFLDRVSVEVSRDKDASGRDAIQASYEIDDDLLLRIERDPFLNYNFGLVARIRFR